jgi:hypothetical protein
MARDHVRKMRERYEDLRSAARVSGTGSRPHNQASAAFSATVRNAGREEFDEFVEQSLTDVLGDDWEQRGGGGRP